MDAPWSIRIARPADAPAIWRLERRTFGDPWSEASFRDAIRWPGSLVLVAELGTELAGYVVGREMAGIAEVLNLAVAESFRRRGLARHLLGEALGRLRRRGALEVYLEVRASNAPAQALYAAAGFVEVGRRAGYYRNPVEDALVLRYLAPASEGGVGGAI